MPTVVVSEDALLHLPPEYFFRLLDPREAGALVQKCIRDGVLLMSAVMAKPDEDEDEDDPNQADDEDAAERLASRIVGLLTTEKRAFVPRTDMGIKLGVALYDTTFQRALNILTERKRITWPEQGSMQLVGMGAKRTPKAKPDAAEKPKSPRKPRAAKVAQEPTPVTTDAVLSVLEDARGSLLRLKVVADRAKLTEEATHAVLLQLVADEVVIERDKHYRLKDTLAEPKATNGAAKQPGLFAEAQA